MSDNISFNFGAIRDTVARLSASELIKENSSKTLNSFILSVKKSPALSKQHLIYKNIENCKPFVKERLAERFIAQNLQIFKNERWDNIISENKRLRRELLDDIHIDSKVDSKLAESINVLIEQATNPAFTDFEKEQQAYEYTLSYLTRQITDKNQESSEREDNPSLVNEAWEFITKMAVSNFNKRYEHLSEQEKKTFSVLISDNKTKEVFLNEIKERNLAKINQLLESENDKDTIEVLNSFKTKVENMNNVNPIIIDEFILSNIDLSETLGLN